MGKEYFGRKVNFAPGVNSYPNFQPFVGTVFFSPRIITWLKLGIQSKLSTWAAVVFKNYTTSREKMLKMI